MWGYNFTERVRRALEAAREEAFRLHHEYVGTEHILLGLIRTDTGVAAVVLENLDADRDKIRETLESMIKKGRPGGPRGPDLPYTSRAKKVLELAMTEAHELGHSYIGTEHILLGLLREERGVAAQVLTHLGVQLATARAEVVRLLGTPMPERRDRAAHPGSKGALRPIGFTIQVDYEGGDTYEDTFERAEDAIAFLRSFSSPA